MEEGGRERREMRKEKGKREIREGGERAEEGRKEVNGGKRREGRADQVERGEREEDGVGIEKVKGGGG